MFGQSGAQRGWVALTPTDATHLNGSWGNIVNGVPGPKVGGWTATRIGY